jgi:hypothetical protein
MMLRGKRKGFKCLLFTMMLTNLDVINLVSSQAHVDEKGRGLNQSKRILKQTG